MANLRKGIQRKIFEIIDESYFTSSGLLGFVTSTQPTI